jgi:hypothetical protein
MLQPSSPGTPSAQREPLLLTTHLEAREELGKRTSIERFFGRIFLFFHLQRPHETSVFPVGLRLFL